jgi:hypothetical protein
MSESQANVTPETTKKYENLVTLYKSIARANLGMLELAEEHPAIVYAVPQGAPVSEEEIHARMRTSAQTLHDLSLMCFRKNLGLMAAKQELKKAEKDLSDAKALHAATADPSQYASWVEAASGVRDWAAEKVGRTQTAREMAYRRLQMQSMEHGFMCAIDSVAEHSRTEGVGEFARGWVETLMGTQANGQQH